ncbi:cytochrome c biogenesis heme-transporting ATPase CcmA [Endozoicomonas montiporae]|uniref:Heme exporter subunit CcmA n=1 Tax=Endozoicomonas montiporae CL-33 TaxID=570277 RepID=A0A142BC34_9GAMM|nr:cytochrome c biogenesis heme-transporting ATPase CcmA [Endozoicomonas montiporae]AMO56310.1 heme exporter subunit CcmA [Endozoicomonas montiporae CL-33]
MLDVINLSAERDDRVLFSNLSTSLAGGALLQVEGPNGAGKTTLLRMLAGLSNDYCGDILWCGEPLRQRYSEFRLNSFYFAHRPAVKAELTAVENIRWRAALRNEHYSDDDVYQALNHVCLSGFEDVVCSQLSAGQHRRVALADLSLSNAALWILDEPFTAIDIDGVAWLETLLAEQVASGGSVIITSHQKLSSLCGSVSRINLSDYQHLPDREASEQESGLFF